MTNVSHRVDAFSFKVPKRFDKECGLVISTDNPKKPFILLLAADQHNKAYWKESILRYVKSVSETPSLVEKCLWNSKEERFKEIFRRNNLFTTHGSECSHGNVATLIACYAGDVVTVCRMSSVCRTWHKYLTMKENPVLWSWLLRHGSVPPSVRWPLWRAMLDVKDSVTTTEFDWRRARTDSFVLSEIVKDVNRAFGVALNRRTTPRRSLLSLDSQEEEEEEDALSPIRGPAKSRASATMDVIPEDDTTEESITLSPKAWPPTPGRDVVKRSVSSGVEQDESVAVSDDDKARKKASLTRILQALGGQFETIGYCQGLDRIVIHVMRAARCAVSIHSVPPAELPRRDAITQERERECFTFLVQFLKKLNLDEVYSSKGVFGLKRRLWELTQLFQSYCPDLFAHLQNEGISLEVFAIGWIQTLFLYMEAMPAITVDRIWDLLIFERDWRVVYQIAIAIMKLSTANVINMPIDHIIDYFYNFPDEWILDAEALIQEASNIHITDEMMTTLDNAFRANGVVEK